MKNYVVAPNQKKNLEFGNVPNANFPNLRHRVQTTKNEDFVGSFGSNEGLLLGGHGGDE